MASQFIEKSKHAAMTAAVQAHFDGNGHRGSPGGDSGKGFAPGGTDAWNGAVADTGSIQAGLVNRAPSGAPTTADDFNASKPGLPQGTGVNYTPSKYAGHTVKDDPFSGNADGMPGDARQLWNK